MYDVSMYPFVFLNLVNFLSVKFLTNFRLMSTLLYINDTDQSIRENDYRVLFFMIWFSMFSSRKNEFLKHYYI